MPLCCCANWVCGCYALHVYQTHLVGYVVVEVGCILPPAAARIEWLAAFGPAKDDLLPRVPQQPARARPLQHLGHNCSLLVCHLAVCEAFLACFLVQDTEDELPLLRGGFPGCHIHSPTKHVALLWVMWNLWCKGNVESMVVPASLPCWAMLS